MSPARPAPSAACGEAGAVHRVGSCRPFRVRAAAASGTPLAAARPKPRAGDAQARPPLDLLGQARQRPVRPVRHRRRQNLLGHRQRPFALVGAGPGGTRVRSASTPSAMNAPRHSRTVSSRPRTPWRFRAGPAGQRQKDARAGSASPRSRDRRGRPRRVSAPRPQPRATCLPAPYPPRSARKPPAASVGQPSKPA